MSAANVVVAAGQGVYSPLPFSDTESSEEEVFDQNSVHKDQKHGLTRKLNSPKHKPNSAQNGSIQMSATGVETSMMADYRPLSNSETSLNGFGDRGRLVLLPSSPTMQEEGKSGSSTPPREARQYGWHTMSSLRKGCFIGSLILCVFTVVGFLWLLPCDMEASCPQWTHPPLDHAHLASTGSWEAVLQGIEVTSAPRLAQGRLLLTVRGPQPLVRSLTTGEPRWTLLGYGPFQPDRSSGGQAGGGVMALWPDTGTLAWAMVTPGASPRDAACDLLDATGDGRHDCLLSNPDWLLAAIDPSTGNLLWFLHAHRENSTLQSRNSSRRVFQPNTQRKPARLRFPPVKVRDVDGDGVPDLCALCSPLLSSSLDSFVLISGRKGSVIGRLVNVSGCVSLTGLEIEEADNTLAFTCINQAGAESVRIMTVDELYLRAVNRSQQDPALLPPLQKRQQPPRDSYEQGWGEGRWYSLWTRGHHLLVENRGSCPRCRATIVLSDPRNNTLWSFSARGEKAMTPVALHFTSGTLHKGTAAGITASLSGFVLKFWQWPSTSPKSSVLAPRTGDGKSTTQLMRMRRAALGPDNAQWNSNHGGAEEGAYNVSPSVLVTPLKERVLLITFNDTDLHVINASQSDVAQLCAVPPTSQRFPGKEPLCQPELPAQQNSLLILDLDEDGTQELVSITSTYVPVREPEVPSSRSGSTKSPGTTSTTWELISKVKVIHLEQELPKLA